MRIYIAGPMSGMPNNGYESFDRKEKQLKEAGWIVINPAEMDRDNGLREDREFSRADYMQAARRDLIALQTVDAIYMLEGFEGSPGACWEWAYAKELGKSIFYEIPLPIKVGEPCK